MANKGTALAARPFHLELGDFIFIHSLQMIPG